MFLALANCALSLMAYARIFFVMRTGEAVVPRLRMSSYDACLTVSLAAVVIVFGLYEAPLLDLAGRSIHLLPR